LPLALFYSFQPGHHLVEYQVSCINYQTPSSSPTVPFSESPNPIVIQVIALTEGYALDGTISGINKQRATDSGMKKVSTLASLPSLSIPALSAPFDVMYFMYLGLVRDLCALLNGKFYKSADLNIHNGRLLTDKAWEKLSINMANIRALVSWGRYPRNIERHIKGFKVEELSNFLIHCLLALAFNRVSPSTYKALQRLVLIISMATSYQVTHREIAEIQNHLGSFIQWYYETFYLGDYHRLAVCKYTCCILYKIYGIGVQLRITGNSHRYKCLNTSKMMLMSKERFCGILIRDVKSRVHGSENLSVLIHQRQLLTFATQFGLFAKALPSHPSISGFTTEKYQVHWTLLPPVQHTPR
jgi:hypothetical protein